MKVNYNNNNNKKYYIINIIIVIIILIILFRCLFINSIESFNININESQNKYVCMYAYYEKNNDYKENFKYFLDNVILKKNDIDYYIIINGECTLELPNESNNIKIIRRKNAGFDFGAWSHCIKNYIKKSYDYYIFLNTSVKGPYPENIEWLKIFLDLFKTDTGNVKLVGTSINVLDNFEIFQNSANTYKELYNYDGPYTHVQSMFFILDKEGFDLLDREKFFDDEEELNNNKDIDYIILNKEIKMSQIILRNGYNINAILSKYKDIDYTKITKNFNPSASDPYNKDTYFGNTITKDEVIFFKTNRF
jgi:hypothetical protein